MRRVFFVFALFFASSWMALLVGCATPTTEVVALSANPVFDNAWTKPHPAVASKEGQARSWRHFLLPNKAATEYTYTRLDGRDAVAVTSNSSASLLRQPVRVEPQDLDHVRFSWKVPELITLADLGNRDTADSTVRIVLAFEGDRARLSAKNAMLSELAHVMTGEPLPYATLMYVWCNTRAPGSVIHSTRTDRIRKIVVESGAAKLNQWLDYERNIRDDYEKAFGEPPGALVAIGIMTDTDNTRTATRAWYGRIDLAQKR